ncbi:unnamed protein product [Prorocentrum cordatum]|uniref:Altered inheritance of mitochondria protein 24, mitochondrial n=1 Tax=Prorocentrum cordatum TaxID=2364126 RepID=A0ABN9SKH5_9DINO|nr:unnamed protein product [Polarella glacialis]
MTALSPGAEQTQGVVPARMILQDGARLQAEQLSIQAFSEMSPAGSMVLGASAQVLLKGGFDCSCSLDQGAHSVFEAGGDITVSAPSLKAAGPRWTEVVDAVPQQVRLGEGARLRGGAVGLLSGRLLVGQSGSLEAERDLQARAQHLALWGSARAVHRGSFHASGSLAVGPGAELTAHAVLAESCGTAAIDGLVQGTIVRVMASLLEGKGSISPPSASAELAERSANEGFCSSLGPDWEASGREAAAEGEGWASLRCTDAADRCHCISLRWREDHPAGARQPPRPTDGGLVHESHTCCAEPKDTISCGGYHTAVLRSDGTVWTAGEGAERPARGRADVRPGHVRRGDGRGAGRGPRRRAHGGPAQGRDGVDRGTGRGGPARGRADVRPGHVRRGDGRGAGRGPRRRAHGGPAQGRDGVDRGMGREGPARGRADVRPGHVRRGDGRGAGRGPRRRAHGGPAQGRDGVDRGKGRGGPARGRADVPPGHVRRGDGRGEGTDRKVFVAWPRAALRQIGAAVSVGARELEQHCSSR